VYSDRVTTLQFVSPTDETVRNSQYLADGTVDPNRALPRNAGFGAVPAAMPLRSIQVTLPVSF
jgi:hypothetical protein